MSRYDALLDRALEEGIIVKEDRSFESDADGLIHGNVIGLSDKLQTQTEKACVLAEELSHYRYNVGNILDINDCESRKQEYKARKRMVFELVPLEKLIEAYEAGVQTRFELAEFLDVTEKFAQEALDIYFDHYGEFEIVEDYCLYFDPLMVVKRF